jgi:hypothetical protein
MTWKGLDSTGNFEECCDEETSVGFKELFINLFLATSGSHHCCLLCNMFLEAAETTQIECNVERRPLRLCVQVLDPVPFLKRTPTQKTAPVIMDLSVFDDMTFDEINNGIVRALGLRSSSKVLLSYSADVIGIEPYSSSTRFKDLFSVDNNEVYVRYEEGKKKPTIDGGSLSDSESHSDSDGFTVTTESEVSAGRDSDEEQEKLTMRKKRSLMKKEQYANSNVLELLCCSRIFGQESVPKVRVLVTADQKCKYLMKDISSLWDRSGLKFRCGRSVLQEEKTFNELGVENNSEITVTGGRG